MQYRRPPCSSRRESPCPGAAPRPRAALLSGRPLSGRTGSSSTRAPPRYTGSARRPSAGSGAADPELCPVRQLVRASIANRQQGDAAGSLYDREKFLERQGGHIRQAMARETSSSFNAVSACPSVAARMSSRSSRPWRSTRRLPHSRKTLPTMSSLWSGRSLVCRCAFSWLAVEAPAAAARPLPCTLEHFPGQRLRLRSGDPPRLDEAVLAKLGVERAQAQA